MNYDVERNSMIDNQIVARGIHDARVIEAMRTVLRHEYVATQYQDNAYGDNPLPIEQGQTISQPYIVALMTELLCLQGDEKVLEIGTGSGYQTAILSELARKVISVERIEQLNVTASKKLEKYSNLTLIVNNGAIGHPNEAPYDAIIVTAAAKELSETFINQLTSNGVLVMPVGENTQYLIKIVKKNESYELKRICPVRFVPLIDG